MSVEVVTFGCRLNAFEAEVIRSKAEGAGLEDTIVINSCAVTNEAVAQARQSIRKLKRERPSARIVVNGYDLERFGPLLENHPIFPDRANITLAHIVDRDHITIRTWERGAGLTKACGSAACATAVAAARLKRANRTVQITLPGGDLTIEWRDRDDHVLMTGPADLEYEGQFDPALFAAVT